MQVTTRHGGGSHFVRPDRVYRTSVLESTMGYDPGQDVQNVAAAFTAYPMDLQTPAPTGNGMSGLAGLGAAFGANNMGFMQRMKLRYDAWKARRARAIQMQGTGTRFNQGMYGLGNGDARRAGGVAYPQVGLSIEPANVGRQDMANILMQSGMQPGIAAAQAGFSWDYWINQRWNG
jgi:hypothetical protein